MTEKFKNQNLIWEILFVQLILKESSARETAQTIVIIYIQQQKSFMTPYHHIESIIYPRDRMKIYYFLLNYLLNKTIKI